MEMEWHYFLGSGEHAETLINMALQRWRVIREHRQALLREYGADELVPDAEGNVRALGFRHNFISPHLTVGVQMGSLYVCEPRRNTPEGLRLATAFERRDVNFSMSAFLLDSLNMRRLYVGPHPAGREYGLVKYAAHASVSPDETRILVAIPGGRKKSTASINDFPSVPEWMREIGFETYCEVQGR